MSRVPHKTTLFWGLPRQGIYWLVGALILSLFLHILSFFGISRVHKSPPFQLSTQGEEKVPVRIVKKKKQSPSDAQKRILETPLEPTRSPEKDSRLGAQDHATEKERKVKPRLLTKGADPGQSGLLRNNKASDLESKATLENRKKIELLSKQNNREPSSKKLLLDSSSVVTLPRPNENRPRNAYEALIPKSHELVRQVQEGYQDYIEDEIETGDRIDFNTTNFRYLGYFTSVRKAFELVWAYPSEAVRRGLQGEVKLEFTIQKDGTVTKIRVLDSSGHKVLDDGVIEALKLASPFAPIPPGMKKERLTIVGSFRYVLTSYAGAL